MRWLSVVIPVRNEAAGIVQVLEPLQRYRGEIEIIVVDGGSEDGTTDLARPLADQMIESSPGRARQMNAGAALARGEVLLFLHADTQLPVGFMGMIEVVLGAVAADPHTKGTTPPSSTPKLDPRVREDDVCGERGVLSADSDPSKNAVIPAHAGTHSDPQQTPRPDHEPSALPDPTMDPRVREDVVCGERGVFFPDSALSNNTVIPAKAGTHFDFDPRSHWGRFDVRLSPVSPALRLVAWMMNQRSRLTGICTGDQAIFVRRELFERIGGYADIPLMEDIDLSKRLKRTCPPACIRQPLTTSSRRWRQNGVFRTILLMWWLRLQYWAGVSPVRLAKKYYPSRHSKP